MSENIHIGNRIKQELGRQERSIAWLARQVYCDRSNLSRLLQNQYIDMDLLQRISTILNHNFFKEISDMVQHDIDNKNIKPEE